MVLIFRYTVDQKAGLSYREKTQLRADIFKIPPDMLGPVVDIISSDMKDGNSVSTIGL